MKKLLLVVILGAIIVALLLLTRRTPPTPTMLPDGKFGFLRDAPNLDQENIEQTGATWLRPNFGYFVWGGMQKDATSEIDFSKTDEVVSRAQKHGLHLVLTIFPFADWDQQVRGDNCRVSDTDELIPRKKGDFQIEGLPYYRCNPVNWAAYAGWLSAVVERYDGDGNQDMPDLIAPVLYYEIGNEPDLTKDPASDGGMVFYLGTPVDYANLLQKSYVAIKSASADAKVLIAAPAGVQPGFKNYWDAVLTTPGISDYFDVGNIHCLSAPNQNPDDPSSASANDLNVTYYKDLLASNEISKPIWVTEAENVQGSNVEANVRRLGNSVKNALANGADKVFFTGASFANDPMRYTTEIFVSEKSYYKTIISE